MNFCFNIRFVFKLKPICVLDGGDERYSTSERHGRQRPPASSTANVNLATAATTTATTTTATTTTDEDATVVFKPGFHSNYLLKLKITVAITKIRLVKH